jgi:hypothetical protein
MFNILLYCDKTVPCNKGFDLQLLKSFKILYGVLSAKP